jgi:hypothetical protein
MQVGAQSVPVGPAQGDLGLRARMKLELARAGLASYHRALRAAVAVAVRPLDLGSFWNVFR